MAELCVSSNLAELGHALQTMWNLQNFLPDKDPCLERSSPELHPIAG